MPATHLISVDLPAPLSPTSAITSPARTSKSAPSRAKTAPKCFSIWRSSRIGVASFTGRFLPRRSARRPGAPHRRFLLAVLLVLALADLVLRQEPVLEQELVVALGDPDRRQQDRRRPADLAVRL